jgi:hypothetical protein
MKLITNDMIRRTVLAMVLVLGTGRAFADFAGTSTGIFANPFGDPATNPDSTTTGAGTSFFTWGVGAPPSSLGFAGGLFSTPPETTFKVGTLTYFNGGINSGTGADSVDLDLELSFTDPTGLDKTFSYTLGLINTPNLGVSPEDDADIVTLPVVPTTTFVADGNTYTLALSFANFSASSFGGSNQFQVFEQATATVDIVGKITTNLNGVPDNGSTLALAGGALLALAGLRRRVRSHA